MSMIDLILPDGSVRTVPRHTTPEEVVASIGRSLAKAALAVEVEHQIWEMNRPLEFGGQFRVLTFEDEKGRLVLRHTGTHVMAQAVLRLFPEAKLGTGPALENGFYYDIDLPQPPEEGDLARIEQEMRKIVEADYPVVREVWTREQALRYFAEQGQPYKVEIIESLPEDQTISVYRQGEFIDLCRGPHVSRTGKIKAFKLMNVAGAYWRGDESRPMLHRLYGTCFEKAKDLEHYLWSLEEAKKRDHRKLGRELGLYTFHEEAPGFAFWHPKGQILYRTLEDFSRRLQEEQGYQEVATPPIMRVDLWKRSGHWQHYQENMFLIDKENEEYAVKPMNCPAHIMLFASQTRSYRDLPIRFAEYGPLARFERSGTLHGLFRVRGLHQDDAHLFVRRDQIESEIGKVLQLVDRVYSAFGMTYKIYLSTRPDDYMGELSLWEEAETGLASALKAAGKPYEINPKDGAFYGPKLDFEVNDSLGRKWQCATIQLDFQMPEKFDLTYMDEHGQAARPVMIHRAIFGSLERFIGILTEHYAGAFPLWLAPEQVRLLTISERHVEKAEQWRQVLNARGWRCRIDGRNEKIGYKIRQAQVEKIPYMIVVGDQEAESGLLSVRKRTEGPLGQMTVEQFLETLEHEAAGMNQVLQGNG